MAGKRRLGPLIITNPTESDSDSGSDVVPRTRQVSPRGALDSIEPPAPIFSYLARSQSVPGDDLSGSSRSSPAPDTTPPPTPGLAHPPTGLLLEHKGAQYHSQGAGVLAERESDSHGIGRAPHHHRRPSNDPQPHPVSVPSRVPHRAHRAPPPQSPTLSISHSYAPVSPVGEPLEHRIIMATEDSALYRKVDITSSRSGEAIRELIFSAVSTARV